MADHTIAAEEISTEEFTLEGGAVDTVTVHGSLGALDVHVIGDAIRYTTDGTTPTLTGEDARTSRYVPPDSSDHNTSVMSYAPSEPAVVTLVSYGTSTVVVAKGDAAR